MEESLNQFGKMMKSATLKIKEQATDLMDRGTPLEKTLRESTANTNWGCSTTLLSEVARASFDYNDYFIIMRTVWECLGDKPSKWRRVFKTLTLLEYLLRNGSERVVDEARETTSLHILRTLMDFHFTEKGADKGTGIRKKATEVYEMINDRELLREEREKARRNRDKYVGIGAHGERSGPGYTYNTNFESGGNDRRGPESYYSTGGRYDPFEPRAGGGGPSGWVASSSSTPKSRATAAAIDNSLGGRRGGSADGGYRNPVAKGKETERQRAEQERDRARKQRERQKEKSRLQRQQDEDAERAKRTEGRSTRHRHSQAASSSVSSSASPTHSRSSSRSSDRSSSGASSDDISSRKRGRGPKRRTSGAGKGRGGGRRRSSSSPSTSRSSSSGSRSNRHRSPRTAGKPHVAAKQNTASTTVNLLDVNASPHTAPPSQFFQHSKPSADFAATDADWGTFSAAPPSGPPSSGPPPVHPSYPSVSPQMGPPAGSGGLAMPDFFAGPSSGFPTQHMGGTRQLMRPGSLGGDPAAAAGSPSIPTNPFAVGGAPYPSSGASQNVPPANNFLTDMPHSLFNLNLTGSTLFPSSTAASTSSSADATFQSLSLRQQHHSSTGGMSAFASSVASPVGSTPQSHQRLPLGGAGPPMRNSFASGGANAHQGAFFSNPTAGFQGGVGFPSPAASNIGGGAYPSAAGTAGQQFFGGSAMGPMSGGAMMMQQQQQQPAFPQRQPVGGSLTYTGGSGGVIF